MKLWQKSDTQTAEQVEQFTVGRDREFDLLLARYDVQGSIAHVTMLEEAGLLTSSETSAALEGLNQILQTIEAGSFRLEEGMEDVHSQVEWQLTQMIGEAGKKIHTGRSRNDQVAVDIKLFLREELKKIVFKTQNLFECLLQQSEVHRLKLLPGYTHLQLAMPSSAGLWLSGYAESLIDDLELLAAAYRIVNKNPLGSGAGYGTGMPLKRRRTTELLGFETLNWSSTYAQMSRGKTEKAVAIGCAALAATMSRFSMDACLYLNQQFGFISFPESLTTGSSIMPHKKNPDVLELIRARCNRIQAVPNELTLLISNLPGGYHRDLQLTKEILFPAMAELLSCVEMLTLMVQQLQVSDRLLEDEKFQHLFSVEAVNQRVRAGKSFREAYREVGVEIADGSYVAPALNLQQEGWHEGSIGNLCLEEIRNEMKKVADRFQ